MLRTLNSFHPAIILELCQSKDSTRNPLLAIPRFATSTNPNLKYLGITMLCQVNPDAWSDAWWTEDLLGAVVQALESRDAAIQRRALDLLYRMLTLENAQNIIDRLVYAFFQEQDDGLQGASSQLGSASSSQKKEKHHQQQVTSPFPSRKEKILGQILDAAERFGPSEEWYLNLMFDLLARGGTTITLQTAEKVMGTLERGKFTHSCIFVGFFFFFQPPLVAHCGTINVKNKQNDDLHVCIPPINVRPRSTNRKKKKKTCSCFFSFSRLSMFSRLYAFVNLFRCQEPRL